MEFLHIIPAKTGDILEFIRCMEKRKDRDEHKFLALVSRNTAIRYVPELLAFPYLEYLETPKGSFSSSRRLRYLKKRLQKADVIIWHSLAMFSGNFIPLLYRNPELCAKSVWIENGQDPDSWESKPDAWENARFKRQNRAVRARIPVVGVPLAADAEYIRRLWPDKRVMTLPYPLRADYVAAADEVRAQPPHNFSAFFRDIRESSDILDFMQWLDVQQDTRDNTKETEEPENTPEQAEQNTSPAEGETAEAAPEAEEESGELSETLAEEENGEAVPIDGEGEPDIPEEEVPEDTLRPPHIQIGLSSTRLNHHLALFQALTAYRGIQHETFVPMNHTLEKLTYDLGPKKYRDNVTSAGKKQWGDLFHVLSNRSDREAYFRYLSELDVAVLGNRTSICAQYLLLLIRAGIKLYYTKNSYVFAWLKKCGVPVYMVEDLQDVPYADFLARDDAWELPDELKLYYDQEAVMDAWGELFHECKMQRGSK